MRSIVNLLGILLIIVGVISLGYQGFTYTKTEKVAEIGSVEITAQKEKTIYLSPLFGALTLVGGIVLVALGRKK
jgi:hypothetical protein